MGSYPSQLQHPPNWAGTWTTTYYDTPIRGRIELILPYNMAVSDKQFNVDVKISYDDDSCYMPGKSILAKFTGTYGAGSTNHYGTMAPVLDMKSSGYIQTISYTSTRVDMQRGIISGTYKSNIPYDVGTFEINRVA